MAPPVISSVSPSTVQVSSGSSASPLTVTITGTNFTPNAKAITGSANLTITSQSSTQIVGTLTTSQIYGTGPVKVYVDNLVATNYYVTSLPATVNVINPTAPISIYPAAAAVGSADLKVTVYGSGYFPG